MKKIISFTILLIVWTMLFAQVPAGFSYQAVVRNTSGEIVANQTVKFRISILQNSESGTAVYVETHSVPTNAYGIANLKVGMGTPVSGILNPAVWGTTSHFMKVEIDPNNSSNYSYLGTTQLLAVPYAFHSATVEVIPDNSVTSAKIANGTVSSADLANNAITTDKINAGAVTAAKISNSGSSANHVLYNNGTNVVWGYAPGAEIKTTIMNVNCPLSFTSITTTYKKIMDVGTMTKLDGSSSLHITFHGRVYVGAFANGSTGARFELRVDNAATTNGRARIVVHSSHASTQVLASMSGVFTGLAAGSHVVSIWAATAYGTASSVTIDPGCWSTDHIVAREVK